MVALLTSTGRDRCGCYFSCSPAEVVGDGTGNSEHPSYEVVCHGRWRLRHAGNVRGRDLCFHATSVSGHGDFDFRDARVETRRTRFPMRWAVNILACVSRWVFRCFRSPATVPIEMFARHCSNKAASLRLLLLALTVIGFFVLLTSVVAG